MNDNNDQIKRNTIIKNAYQNLLFTTLPTNNEEAKEFFSRLIEISKIESERVVNEYSGFDFEALKNDSIQAYNENIVFFEKYQSKLHLTKSIEKKLIEIDYDIDTYDFCKIYNELYPCFLRVFNDYIGYDVESLKKDDYEAYKENMNYINRYMERGGEIYSVAIKNHSEYKEDITEISNPNEIDIKLSKNKLLAQKNLSHLLDTNLFIADGLDSKISAITSVIIDLIEIENINEDFFQVIEKNMKEVISVFEDFQKYLNRIRFEINTLKKMYSDNHTSILLEVLSYTYFGAEWWLERFEKLEQSEIDKHNLIAAYKSK
ncbi:hypothetical protein PEC311524_36250 [Pectobacterium carotovorum subsp. carotovorum]|nr:hypothetical protein PEC311524_36250 [Pectobacterium carotovorum subsp. carotovorum]